MHVVNSALVVYISVWGEMNKKGNIVKLLKKLLAWELHFIQVLMVEVVVS